MTHTLDLQTLLLLFGAVLFGVLVTVLAQVAQSFRTLTREVTDTSRRMRDVAETLQPFAQRMNQLSALAEESEPDLRRLQLALRGFTNAAVEASQSLSRVNRIVAIVAPVALAAAKRWLDDDGAPRHDDGGADPTAPTNGAGPRGG